VLKGVSKCECEITPLEIVIVVFFVMILEVSKILTSSNPPKIFFVFFKCLIVIFNQLLRILLFFNRVHQNFHSIIIKTFILYHIQHIEFDFKPLFRIINSEIKPLSMPL
jgi:hypothetical protein